MKPKGGFTLIELLVVVAIIMMLAGPLFPVLNKVVCPDHPAWRWSRLSNIS